MTMASEQIALHDHPRSFLAGRILQLADFVAFMVRIAFERQH
jgi:hypothetical protein